MRLTLGLPPEESSFVENAVRSGDFPDAATVVVAALRNMRTDDDTILGYTMDELRRLGDEAEASGIAEDFDFEEVKRKIRQQTGIQGAEG